MELRVIYECEFVEIKNNNPEICHGVDEMLSSFRLAGPHIKIISSEIPLKAVESAKLTGMFHVDIRCPLKRSQIPNKRDPWRNFQGPKKCTLWFTILLNKINCDDQ